MRYREVVLPVESAGETLLGLVAQPEAMNATGVLILVGGPQYRVGSHRQFVLLARRLAAEGYAAMRFDFRGMGDSTGDFPGFEHVGADIDAAIAAFFRACPALKRVVLWGLCDAASAALLYSGEHQDAHLAGLCLLNPWVRSEGSLAETRIRRYYLQRLLQRDFWLKLLDGRFRLGQSLTSLGQNLRSVLAGSGRSPGKPCFQEQMADEMRRFPGRLLLILGGEDMTGKEFELAARSDPAWAGVLGRPDLACHRVAGADHTFSSRRWRQEVEQVVLDWLNEHLR
jgi:uncharacterized protein